MKTFRIKLKSKQTFTHTFDFIFLEKCKKIDLKYSILGHFAHIELQTIDDKIYTLSRGMSNVDYQQFESRFKKFHSTDDIFFDLAAFSAELSTKEDQV